MVVSGVIDAVARELTLFAATGFLIGGIDDLAVDGLFLLRRFCSRGDAGPRRVADLPSAPPARFAVLVAAWQEAEVIGAMLAATLARYRHPDYILFVATYPNDRATIDVVARVAERDPRLRLVVNPRPGPTTKADNLNAAWLALEREEATSGRGFDAVLIHDAEDVVHPDELTVCEALIRDADVIQLPVRPLIHARARFVSGHYADEFAESRKQMTLRTALGAAMPLAGTGCAISTAMLRRVAGLRGGLPFEPTSLTEDYEIYGVQDKTYYANDNVIRTRAPITSEFVARELIRRSR